jgi:hypothetical protein
MAPPVRTHNMTNWALDGDLKNSRVRCLLLVEVDDTPLLSMTKTGNGR